MTDFLTEDNILPAVNSEYFLNTLQNTLNKICSAINQKDSGMYEEVEQITGQQYVPIYLEDSGESLSYRNVFRKVVTITEFPKDTTLSTAHGIDLDENSTIVRLYGAATKIKSSAFNSGISLPFLISGATNGLELYINATDVCLKSTGDFSDYTRGFVVIEYLKNI